MRFNEGFNGKITTSEFQAVVPLHSYNTTQVVLNTADKENTFGCSAGAHGSFAFDNVAVQFKKVQKIVDNCIHD